MRPLRILLLGTVLGAAALGGCDCESMLAAKRRPGAPTSSAGPEAEPEPPPAAAPAPARVTRPARRPDPVKPAVPPPEPVEVEKKKVAAQPSPPGTLVPANLAPGSLQVKPFQRVKLPRTTLPQERFGRDFRLPDDVEGETHKEKRR